MLKRSRREWTKLLASLRFVGAPAVLTVLTGRRAGAIGREVTTADGPISAELGGRLRDPALLFSLRLRTALALGIVFVMSLKPALAGSLTAMGVAAVLGVAAGLPVWTRSATVDSVS